MNDALEALTMPIEPVAPDPAFAARLRQRLRDALLATTTGGTMTATDVSTPTHEAEQFAWPPALSPYIAVSDGRRAIDWYVTVFDGRLRGNVYEGADGSIGHAEIALGDAVLMLSESSTVVPVAAPPPGPRQHSHSLHLQVADVDATVRRAAAEGADVERHPEDQPYGRVAVIVDPFSHRWLLNQPPGRATRVGHGDVGYITITTPDDVQARLFYGAVLGWQFTPGRVERGWNVEGRAPMLGLHGDPAQPGGATLCFRVDDIHVALDRVRAAGGEGGRPDPQPYGLLAECLDDQGVAFQLWQPTD